MLILSTPEQTKSRTTLLFLDELAKVMNSFGSDLDEFLTYLGGIVLIVGFTVLVIPVAFAVLGVLSQGFTGNSEQAMSLLMSLPQSWWIGFAISAPILFVLFGMFLDWIGAEAVMEM